MEKDGDEGNYLSDKRGEKASRDGVFQKIRENINYFFLICIDNVSLWCYNL